MPPKGFPHTTKVAKKCTKQSRGSSLPVRKCTVSPQQWCYPQCSWDYKTSHVISSRGQVRVPILQYRQSCQIWIFSGNGARTATYLDANRKLNWWRHYEQQSPPNMKTNGDVFTILGYCNNNFISFHGQDQQTMPTIGLNITQPPITKICPLKFLTPYKKALVLQAWLLCSSSRVWYATLHELTPEEPKI